MQGLLGSVQVIASEVSDSMSSVNSAGALPRHLAVLKEADTQ
jgi:hypothetical protein